MTIAAGQESFRPIADAPQYEINDSGRVRHRPSGRIRKPWQHKSGHLYIRVRVGQTPMRRRSFPVHRLVLIAFVGPVPAGCEARHVNGIPDDNHLSNLRWGTRRENIADLIVMTGRSSHAALSSSTVHDIRAAHGDRLKYRRGEVAAIAERYGVSKSVIYRLLNGETYR